MDILLPAHPCDGGVCEGEGREAVAGVCEGGRQSQLWGMGQGPARP